MKLCKRIIQIYSLILIVWFSVTAQANSDYCSESLTTTDEFVDLGTLSQSWQTTDYALLIYQPMKYVDLYYAISAWSSSSCNVLSFKPNTASLQEDFFGRTNLASSIVQLNYQVADRVQVYSGVIIPTRYSGSMFYGILGVAMSY